MSEIETQVPLKTAMAACLWCIAIALVLGFALGLFIGLESARADRRRDFESTDFAPAVKSIQQKGGKGTDSPLCLSSLWAGRREIPSSTSRHFEKRRPHGRQLLRRSNSGH